MFDFVVKNGTVIDGTGAEPVRTDVAINRDKVIAVGHLPVEAARWRHVRASSADGDTMAKSGGQCLCDHQYCRELRHDGKCHVIRFCDPGDDEQGARPCEDAGNVAAVPEAK